jgi:hypothetical protein
MAWAGNVIAVEPATGERRSIMRTHVFDGVILSIHIEEEYGDTIEINRLFLSWR